MSKKDYQAIARAIYGARMRVEQPPANVRVNVSDCLLGIAHATENIADALQRDSYRFDRERFIEACETGTCKGMPKRAA